MISIHSTYFQNTATTV